jgi:hypothetical protein
MSVFEAVEMWESRTDFQRVWEGWEAGFIAFHAFHTLAFPWPALLFASKKMFELRHIRSGTIKMGA